MINKDEAQNKFFEVAVNKYKSDYENGDFFNKVINIKFLRKNGTGFTIRSDYEPVWTDNGDLYFKTCSMKPTIKVEYKQLKNFTWRYKISVTNLMVYAPFYDKAENDYGLDFLVPPSEYQHNKENLELLQSGDKSIATCIVQIGYLNQFPKWSYYDRTKHSTQDAWEKFINLEEITARGRERTEKLAQTSLFGKMQQVKLQCLSAYNTGQRPERVTVFDCVVGNVEPIKMATNQMMVDDMYWTASEIMKGAHAEKDNNLETEKVTQKNINEVNNKDKSNANIKAQNKVKTSNELSKIQRPINYFTAKPFTFLEAYAFNAITRRTINNTIESLPFKNNEVFNKLISERTYKHGDEEMKENPMEVTKNRIYQNMLKSLYGKGYGIVQTEIDGMIKYSFDENSEEYKKLGIVKKKEIDETVNRQISMKFCGSYLTAKNLIKGYRTFDELQRLFKTKRMTWDEFVEHKIEENRIDISKDNEEVFVFKDNEEGVTRYYKGVCDEKDSLYKKLTQDNAFVIINSEVFESLNVAETDGYKKTTVKNLKRDVYYFIPTQQSRSSVFIERKGKYITWKDKSIIKEYQKAKLFEGFFPVKDAYYLGYRVYCTDKASKQFEEYLKEHNGKATINFLGNVQAQIEDICRTFNLKYYLVGQQTNSYILATINDTLEDINNALPNEDFEKPKKIPIPAIYSFEGTPLRQIRCPFFNILDNFTIVTADCKDIVGNLVTYFYHPAKRYADFQVIMTEVSFSTTGQENEMTIQCVDHNGNNEVRELEGVKIATAVEEDKEYYKLHIPVKNNNFYLAIYGNGANKLLDVYNTLWQEKYKDYLDENGSISPKSFYKILIEELLGEDNKEIKSWFEKEEYEEERADGTKIKINKAIKFNIFGDLEFPNLEMYFKVNNIEKEKRRFVIRNPFFPKAFYSGKKLTSEFNWNINNPLSSEIIEGSK